MAAQLLVEIDRREGRSAVLVDLVGQMRASALDGRASEPSD